MKRLIAAFAFVCLAVSAEAQSLTVAQIETSTPVTPPVSPLPISLLSPNLAATSPLVLTGGTFSCPTCTGGGGGGATIPTTTDLIKGDGAGNGADSGIPACSPP